MLYYNVLEELQETNQTCLDEQIYFRVALAIVSLDTVHSHCEGILSKGMNTEMQG